MPVKVIQPELTEYLVADYLTQVHSWHLVGHSLIVPPELAEAADRLIGYWDARRTAELARPLFAGYHPGL